MGTECACLSQTQQHHCTHVPVEIQLMLPHNLGLFQVILGTEDDKTQWDSCLYVYGCIPNGPMGPGHLRWTLWPSQELGAGPRRTAVSQHRVTACRYAVFLFLTFRL